MHGAAPCSAHLGTEGFETGDDTQLTIIRAHCEMEKTVAEDHTVDAEKSVLMIWDLCPCK